MKKLVIEFPEDFNISDLEAAQLYEMGKLSILDRQLNML
jgi:hypothetical protein